MKRLILATAIIVTAISCQEKTKAEKKFDNETYEKSKESLGDKELKNPARFLKVDSRDRKNLIGQTVVKGTITNTASVCTYKDIDIKLTYYSKTAVKLDEGIETVYEVIPPGGSAKFKTKSFAPKGTDSVAIQIMKATGEVAK